MSGGPVSRDLRAQSLVLATSIVRIDCSVVASESHSRAVREGTESSRESKSAEVESINETERRELS